LLLVAHEKWHKAGDVADEADLQRGQDLRL
jgi:hypothetical protein